MAKISQKNTPRELDIYVILSEISDEFIVWKIKSGNAYTTYKDHARLKSMYTKELFLRSIEAGKMPKMYLLETIICSQREAMKHCIVWTKYFREHGKIPLNGEVMVGYSDTLDEQSLALYNKIKDRPFDEIIRPETAIVETYRPNSQKKSLDNPAKNREGSVRVNLTFNPEQYKIMKEKAAYVHMPAAKYCRVMALNGFVFVFDHAEYVREIRSIKRTIQDIQEAIYQNGKYYPADIENLEKCIDEVNDVQMKMLKETVKVVKKYAAKMPEASHEKHKK